MVVSYSRDSLVPRSSPLGSLNTSASFGVSDPKYTTSTGPLSGSCLPILSLLEGCSLCGLIGYSINISYAVYASRFESIRVETVPELAILFVQFSKGILRSLVDKSSDVYEFFMRIILLQLK